MAVVITACANSTPPAGTCIATLVVSTEHHQKMVIADASGSILGTSSSPLHAAVVGTPTFNIGNSTGSVNIINSTGSMLVTNLTGSAAGSPTFSSITNLAGSAAGSPLFVNLVNGGAGGTALVDGSPFTIGTTSFTPIGGEIQSSACLTGSNAGAAGMTAWRSMYVTVRGASGNEFGLGSGSPLFVSVTNSTGSVAITNPTGSVNIINSTGSVLVTNMAASMLVTNLTGSAAGSPLFVTQNNVTGSAAGSPTFVSITNLGGSAAGSPLFVSACLTNFAGSATGSPLFVSVTNLAGSAAGSPLFHITTNNTGSAAGSPTFVSVNNLTGSAAGSPTFSSITNLAGSAAGSPLFVKLSDSIDTAIITSTSALVVTQDGGRVWWAGSPFLSQLANINVASATACTTIVASTAGSAVVVLAATYTTSSCQFIGWIASGAGGASANVQTAMPFGTFGGMDANRAPHALWTFPSGSNVRITTTSACQVAGNILYIVVPS